MTDKDWANFFIAAAIVLPTFAAAGGLGWFIFWFWFAPLYHPLDCRCRRCSHREASTTRRDARLARASRR